MAKRAGMVSVRWPPGAPPEDAADRAEALAHHLVGQTVTVGDSIALPGWPSVTIDETDPAGEVVVDQDTRVEQWWPPKAEAAPVSLLFVVDASLTMGRGPAGATSLDRAAWAIESVVLNAHGAIERVGILVHGSTPRFTQPPVAPEELNAHVIHRVEPRGMFDIRKGVEAGIDLLATTGAGVPKVLVVVTDGRSVPSDGAGSVAAARRRGVHPFVFVADLGAPVVPGAELKAVTFTSPKPIGEAVSRISGVAIRWQDRPPPEPIPPGTPEFEIVIEAVDEEQP